MNKVTSLILILLAVLLLSGCSGEAEDDSKSYDVLLAGYYMIAGEKSAISDSESGLSRATAPAYWDEYNDLTYAQVIAMGLDGIKISNYPERGQKTYVTVKATDDDDIFFVSSRTEYPNKNELLDYYIEEYYLSDDVWDTGLWKDGAVCTSAGVLDETARVRMEVVFEDGSIRKEWIDDVHTSAGGTASYAQFDIDGDMSFPDSSWTGPETDSAANWSSKVYYYQEVETNIGWFRTENTEIFGVRYYTNFDDPNDGDGWPSSTLAYEHAVSRTKSAWENSDWAEILNWLFGSGSSSTSGSDSGTTLAETVIREEIKENGKKTTVSSTTVVPTFGDTFTIDRSIDYDLLD